MSSAVPVQGADWRPSTELWDAVDALVGRMNRVDEVVEHRVAGIAARVLRSQGCEVPDEYLDFERRAAVASLVAPAVLTRVREAVDGELLLLKGPEVAARYPDPALRGFGDLDLLVRDPAGVHEALVASGAEAIGDPELYVGIHHLRPLAWPGLPLAVEIHSRPKWVDRLRPIDSATLFERTQPAAVAVKGVLAPAPAEHAVLIAVHSWAHEPLRRLRDIIDVAALLTETRRDDAAKVATRWGVERLWRTTVAAVDALIYEEQPGLVLRFWARNLAQARGRTVLEEHLQRLFSDFSILAPRAAARRLPATILRELQPEPDESWRRKGRRTILALRNGFRRRFEHDEQLARDRVK
jgi:hypothetical protein